MGDSKTAEIVARLRMVVPRDHLRADGKPFLEREAADLLEANACEIERLEKERDEAIRQLAEEGMRRGEAEAERDKLRETIGAAPLRYHAVNLEQCALFVDSEPLARSMTDAAACLRSMASLLTPAASGAEQGGEDHQLRPVEPAVDRGPQVTSALPGACAEKVAGARIDALEEAAKAMETTRDFGDTNVANAVRVVAARAIRKLKETGNGS